jgi:hypothetical protein
MAGVYFEFVLKSQRMPVNQPPAAVAMDAQYSIGLSVS